MWKTGCVGARLATARCRLLAEGQTRKSAASGPGDHLALSSNPCGHPRSQRCRQNLSVLPQRLHRRAAIGDDSVTCYQARLNGVSTSSPPIDDGCVFPPLMLAALPIPGCHRRLLSLIHLCLPGCRHVIASSMPHAACLQHGQHAAFNDRGVATASTDRDRRRRVTDRTERAAFVHGKMGDGPRLDRWLMDRHTY